MYYCLLLILASVTILRSQNLVPNPSFEDVRQPSCNINQYFLQDVLKDWLQPITTTPDYWSTLSDPACFLNPGNVAVSPRTGQGMVGIITANIKMGQKIEYKEYVEVKLLSELEKGNFYNVEFYAKSQQKNISSSDILLANNLGAAFSDSIILPSVATTSPDHLLLNPAIKEENIIYEEWQKIGGCFIAGSPSAYLLIGNFNTINSTEIVQLTQTNMSAFAYYFVDDVKVEALPYDLSKLMKSVAWCPEKPFVELNAYVDGATEYHWENGSNQPAFNVYDKVTRDYVVNISFNECKYEHVFHVEYTPEVNIGRDTTLCYGDILEIKPSHPAKEYLWSDGSTDSVKYISSPGLYTVSVSSGCTVTDGLEVNFIDCPGYTPNIITPNKDPYNEFLEFENIHTKAWSLTILSRWGQQVFFAADYKNDWNGYNLPEGIYYYRLFSRELNKEVKGAVQVVR